jgi:hypothetical protein
VVFCGFKSYHGVLFIYYIGAGALKMVGYNKKRDWLQSLLQPTTFSLDDIANKKFTSNKEYRNGKQSLEKESDVFNHSGLFR